MLVHDNVIEDVEENDLPLKKHSDSIATDNVEMVNEKGEKYYLCVNGKKSICGCTRW